MIMARSTLGSISLAMALAACTVAGKDVETTFGDPTANPSGTPPSSGNSDTEGTEEGTGETSSASAGSTSETTTATTAPSESSGAPPADEQPANGMYSECAGVADCIGLNTCVLAGASGFCSNTGCVDASTQCDANPGASSTAPPTCVDNGAGQMVCALGCAGGQTCPGGMDCVPLGATMVCV